jgi:hypothetical protein
MEKEDMIIRELLEEEMSAKAPEGFTSIVMDAVMQAEEHKKPIIQTDTLIVMISVLVSLVAPVLVFYYFNISVLDAISRYIKRNEFGFGNIQELLNGLSQQLLGIKTLFLSSPLVLPLFLGLSALIIIERLIAKSKYGLNIFISI